MKAPYHYIFFFTLLLCQAFTVSAQELFVFTEPASNMPAKSISAKYSGKLLESTMHGVRIEQRHTAEIMFGLNKNWMVHGAVTFSDMYTTQLRFESGRLYAKYRFLSNDDVHKHFRMAAFAEVSRSRNEQMFDELSLDGDNSGFLGGVIATQLSKKFAFSSTVSLLQLTGGRAKAFPGAYSSRALNYTASAGLLVLPLQYTSYNQTNLNVYAELLGQQSLDQQKYFLDFAPSVQLIFNSTYKLNLGYRFQLKTNMARMSANSFNVAFETVFLNALKRNTAE